MIDMLQQKFSVNFTENAQQQLNRLYIEWRQLRAMGKFFEADQLKHQIKLLKRRTKTLPKKEANARLG